LRAYRQDLQVIVNFLNRHKQTFKSIDFVVVKTFNHEMKNLYANRSAVRRLDFLRRILEFGYITHFYKTPLAPWIEKPSVTKGHYTDKKKQNGELSNRTDYRELSEEEAMYLASLLPKIVKSKRYREQYIARNNLLGQLLFLTGMRSSEILSLNWGSFRKNRKNKLVVDVIGKGGKERTIPVFDNVRKALIEYREAMGESVDLDKGDTSPLIYNIERFDQYKEKNRISYTTLFRIVKKAVHESGMDENISPHWFRHSFCTTSLAKDIPLSIVRQTMGHSSIATTNIYLERLKDENLFEAFEKAGF
jgi:integrase/recombinase XerD